MLLRYNLWLELKLGLQQRSRPRPLCRPGEERAAAQARGNSPPQGSQADAHSNPKLLLIPLLGKHRFVRAHDRLPAQGADRPGQLLGEIPLHWK